MRRLRRPTLIPVQQPGGDAVKETRPIYPRRGADRDRGRDTTGVLAMEPRIDTNNANMSFVDAKFFGNIKDMWNSAKGTAEESDLKKKQKEYEKLEAERQELEIALEKAKDEAGLNGTPISQLNEDLVLGVEAVEQRIALQNALRKYRAIEGDTEKALEENKKAQNAVDAKETAAAGALTRRPYVTRLGGH